jgi:hypothetical protein
MRKGPPHDERSPRILERTGNQLVFAHRVIWFLIAGLLVAAYIVGGYFVGRRAQRTTEQPVPVELRRRLGHEPAPAACAAAADSLRWHVQRWLRRHDRRRPPDDFDPTWLLKHDTDDLAVTDLDDPWGRPFLVVSPGREGRAFDIVSYGADGRPGGEGEDRDIVR